jgi:Fe-S-cluster-containing dehydrogenase component/anaerobic selenocysteine-containing dehydrogenase
MKKYWKSLDEYQNIPDTQTDIIESGDKNAILELFNDNVAKAKSNRRDFLKLFGFSVTTAAIAASCEKPVHKAIPYVIQPEEIVPGKASYYASSFFDGKDYCPVMVKVRDGRPIKIEGNKLSLFNKGGTTARVQASVLSLYDDARYKYPAKSGNEASWEEIDAEVLKRLTAIDKSGREVVLVSSGLASPSLSDLVEKFGKGFNHFKHIQYNAISHSAMADAMEINYGSRFIPVYQFDKADVVVSLGADFLGSWIAPAFFIPAYASRRKLDNGEKTMLKHFQLEAGMSLTGSNADQRIQIKPSDEKAILANIFNEIAASKGLSTINAPESGIDVKEIAHQLKEAGSRGMIISSSNDLQCQLLVNAINNLLENDGDCIDYSSSLHVGTASDNEMLDLTEKMFNGSVGAILFYKVNPLYDFPLAEKFSEGIKNTDLSLSFASSLEETASACEFICPDHHYLESWGDIQVLDNEISLMQPCIHPIFNTRSFADSLLSWMGNDSGYYNYLKDFWEKEVYKGGLGFSKFWNISLQNGLTKLKVKKEKPDYKPAVDKLVFDNTSKSSGMELVLVESIQMGDGRHANNPWLQELPDPIAKVSWENFLSISFSDAEEKGLVNGDILKVANKIDVPVFIQPGQSKGTVSLALGYGREGSGKVASISGVNAYKLMAFSEGHLMYYLPNVELEKTGRNVQLAMTQTHHSMEGRPIVRETTLEEYLESPDAGNELHEEFESNHQTLYPEPEFKGFHWGLAVDLNACVGCNSCVISCQAENNIPVVGKDEVYRRRIMHWIKIDRYYSESPDDPKVSFQPVMCQHCDNAPCENVCPVSATNHSSEGLNQMSYNRCIGTKYCINNCPYRVRRFNWYKYTNNDEFDYNINSDLGKMVLNPDVTVRGRGVVEKCSFCVQRIQEKKLEAKLENRSLNDGDIQPACVQACPAGALIFGDLSNKESKVSKLFADSRNYHLLEELHTLPSVGYLTKVRNEDKKENKTS